MKRATMSSTLFFLCYLPITGETSVIATKKSSENFASGLEYLWIYAKFRANSRTIWTIFSFFSKKKNVSTDKKC